MKVVITELEQALQLIKSSSTDVTLLIKEDGHTLSIQYGNADGQICNITIFDESTRLYAKVTAAENLRTVLARQK